MSENISELNEPYKKEIDYLEKIAEDFNKENIFKNFYLRFIDVEFEYSRIYFEVIRNRNENIELYEEHRDIIAGITKAYIQVELNKSDTFKNFILYVNVGIDYDTNKGVENIEEEINRLFPGIPIPDNL